MKVQTSLESIAQKLEQKKSEELEDILMRSGSMASKKNDYGITIVDDVDSASSLVFKSINRPKLDKDEITKAIDIEIKELKPNIPTVRRDLVPKPLYDEQVVLVADLSNQVRQLNEQISDLNSQISSLEAQVETEVNNRLTIEQTNDALSNQLASLSKTIEDFANQIQSAIQKSVEESILRASLQSQNAGFRVQVEALIKQIDSLNSIIEGLQAQLGAVQQQQAIQQSTTNLAAATGGTVMNSVVIVDFNPPGPKTEPKIHATWANGSGHEWRWDRGSSIKFTNNDKQPVEIQLEHTMNEGYFFKFPKTQFTIQGGESEDIELQFEYALPYDFKGHSQDRNGALVISVKRYDGSVDTKKFLTRCREQYKEL